MRTFLAFWLVLSLALVGDSTAKKKTKKNKIDPKVLKCLICRAVVDEIETGIKKVDPKKMSDSVKSFRIDSSGNHAGRRIPYARSQGHLMELTEKICEDGMTEYAQATLKKSGEPTLVRMVTQKGNMNPDVSKVDFIKDEDLNTPLKYQCQAFVDDNEEVILSVLAEENDKAKDEICVERTSTCDRLTKDEL